MKLNFGFGEEWKNLKKFETLSIEDKSIVFYAENIASINHFHNLIKKLTEEKIWMFVMLLLKKKIYY